MEPGISAPFAQDGKKDQHVRGDVRLRIEAIGTKLIVYVNDQVRLQASDASHPRGRYGVVTYRAAASFSNLAVWQP